MIERIYAYLRFILLVLIVSFKTALLILVIYSEQKNDCLCGKDWYRIVIKLGCIFVIILCLVSYFTPIVKIFRMIPIIGGFVIIAVICVLVLLFYAIKTYMEAFDDDNCRCRFKKQLKMFNSILSLVNTMTLSIIILILIIAIFYIF